MWQPVKSIMTSLLLANKLYYFEESVMKERNSPKSPHSPKNTIGSQIASKPSQGIEAFIDSLISPPSLSNSLRRSGSENGLNDSLTIHRDSRTPDVGKELPKLTPVKKRPQSEEKSTQVFTNSKIYFDGYDAASSVNQSELRDQPLLSSLSPSKYVRFKENIISRHEHNAKPTELRRTSRTPSILKKSQMIRQISDQLIQQSHIEKLPHHTYPPAVDRQARAIKTNEVVKKRYMTILERGQARMQAKRSKGMAVRTDEKYRDQLFPPIISSIFRGGIVKNQQYSHNQIRWVRITDLFKSRELVIYKPNKPSSLDIYCNQICSCKDCVGEAFTCVKNNRQLLSKIFEVTEINEFGVYMVKIFQENVWKYVIVDDNIPVMASEEGYLEPIFLNVADEEENQVKGPFEIWPFLLEKAYANYYANYESLHFGNTLDLLEEITGLSCQTFQYVPNLQVLKTHTKRLQDYMTTESTMILGYGQQQNQYYPIEQNSHSIWTSRLDKQTLNRTVITLDNVFDYFDKICVMNSHKWTSSCFNSVGINIRRGPSTPNTRFDISMRVLKVKESGDVSIWIRQKEKRFYQNSSLNYNYIWVRVLLLQKETEGDARWIAAGYSNKKTISFNKKLQAGEYYVIVLPQWKSSHCYELSLMAHSTTPEGVSLTRREYDEKQKLFEMGCRDLAQRTGRLHQINLYACSYSFIHEDTGILIQNINNQRFNGDIRINRSISGLKAAVDIVPFNVEFYYQVRNTKSAFKQQLSVTIENDKSYTVVLMMRGGIDREFLKWFDFGK